MVLQLSYKKWSQTMISSRSNFYERFCFERDIRVFSNWNLCQAFSNCMVARAVLWEPHSEEFLCSVASVNINLSQIAVFSDYCWKNLRCRQIRLINSKKSNYDDLASTFFTFPLLMQKIARRQIIVTLFGGHNILPFWTSLNPLWLTFNASIKG